MVFNEFLDLLFSEPINRKFSVRLLRSFNQSNPPASRTPAAQGDTTISRLATTVSIQAHPEEIFALFEPLPLTPTPGADVWAPTRRRYLLLVDRLGHQRS